MKMTHPPIHKIKKGILFDTVCDDDNAECFCVDWKAVTCKKCLNYKKVKK